MIDRIFRRLVVGAALAFGVLFAAPAGAQSSVGITINGNTVNVYPAPIVQAGRVFVPLRGVFEQLGASVVYDNGQINATGNNTVIALQIGSTQATVNGQTQTIDVAPFIVGASTYVPLRFVSQALGASVSYDDANRVVAIATSNGGYQGEPQPQGPPSFYETGYDVSQPPPPIPEYDQPPVPEPNYIWQPGCWAWSPSGYYWVPGTWVPAPQPNLLWTPGYWSFNIGSFGWHPGYWASQVGFYGGINYGGGYNGDGYQGGRWSDGAFRYNSAASNVTNSTVIHNEYVYNSVVNNYTTTRTSYNGGPTGVAARPNAAQLAAARETHVPVTPLQRQHADIAAQDRRLLASVNAGKPPVVVAPRPYTPETKPADLVPVTPEDRTAAEKLVVHPRVVAPPVHPGVAEPAHPAVVHPDAGKPPVHPETVATPLRPRELAPPVRPDAVTPPVAKPNVVTPPVNPAVVHPPVVHPPVVNPPVAHPAVVHPAAPAVVHPAVVHPPVIHPAVVHPPVAHPAVVRPVPPVHPQVVKPVPPHPAVAHPAPPKPAPHPEDKPEHPPGR